MSASLPKPGDFKDVGGGVMRATFPGDAPGRPHMSEVRFDQRTGKHHWKLVEPDERTQTKSRVLVGASYSIAGVEADMARARNIETGAAVPQKAAEPQTPNAERDMAAARAAAARGKVHTSMRRGR